MLSVINTAFLFLALLFYGCGTINKPNTPYANSIPELQQIENKNRLIAMEIKKLPDILDGLSQNERKAIESISLIYESKTNEFEKAFIEMYKIGLPNHRKYCSPFQAFFWLVMERDSLKIDKLLESYTLRKLLDEAWTFSPELTQEVYEEIVNTIKVPEVRKYFETGIPHNNMRLKSRLITEIELFPEIFPDWVPQKLNELQSKSSWNDYYEVLDRLNAPELVDYFVKKQISYQYYWAIPGHRGSQGSAYYVFNNKKGDCLYISTFIVKALRRNGYRAWVEKMPPVGSVGEFHAVCVFKLNGEKYIIDDGRGVKRGIMKYPEYLRYSYTSLPKSFY